MKKYLLMIFISMLLSCLSACDDTVKEPIDEKLMCEEIETMISNACEIMLPDNSITETMNHSIINNTTEFDIPISNVMVYEHPNYPGMKYVDVEEFIGALSGALIDLDFTKDDVLKITHIMVDPDNENNVFSLIIEIDSEQNTLFFNDFNYVDYMNNLDDEINSDIKLETTGYVSGTTAKTIDLDDYGFDVIENENSYYLPLSVASLFFSGSYINTYVLDDEIHVVSDFVSNTDLFEQDNLSGDEEKNILEETKKYTTLFFDYFYGLKNFYRIDSYYDVFYQIGLYNAKTLKEFNEILTQYILDLDELHTNVVDFGINADEVDQGSFVAGRKTIKFYTTNLQNRCNIYNENVMLYDKYSYYVLKINGFDETTPDDLARLLGDVSPGKDIYIDLSCNSGGLVYAALDVLQYMTNDPINLRVSNTQTGEIVTTTITTDVIDALPNVFYLFTSNVTFSAANILTKLVQENGLAIVLGDMTSGGAAAVQYAVLPNNFVLTHSSNTVFVDKEGTPMEAQLIPDFIVTIGDVYDISYKISYFIGSKFSFDYTYASVLSYLDIAIDVTKEQYTINSIEIEAWDLETSELISVAEYTEDSFHFLQTIDDSHKLATLRMIVNYQKNGHNYRYQYFSYILDDLPETADVNAPIIDFETVYNTTQHRYKDRDFFRIVLDKAKTFRVLINGSYVDDSVDVYDESGEKLYHGNTFSLSAGTYYVEVEDIYVDKFVRYTIELVEIYDDYVDPAHIALQEGDNEVTLTYDFEGDTESILFTITEEALITVNWIYNDSLYYFIRDVNREILNTNRNSLYNSQTFLLPIGTYYLGFSNVMFESVTATFTVTYIDDEISGSFDQPNPIFGTFNMGENTITFDGRFDTDIYVLTITEETDIQIVRSGYFMVQEIDSFGDPIYWNQYIKTFAPGTYYFLLHNYAYVIPTVETVTLIDRKDLSDENNQIPLIFGEQFDVLMEFDGDQDFYTFTIDELQYVELGIEVYRSTPFEFRNSDGDVLYIGNSRDISGRIIYMLYPGDYVLVIGEQNSDYIHLVTYKIKLSLVDIVDP